MTEAFIGVGSNLGDKAGNIRRAISLLGASEGILKLDTGTLYRTDPVGVLDQAWFINTVVRVETTHTCRKLLELCLSVEQALKRVRDERWGPRTIDLDVLLFGASTVKEKGLDVPHPRMKERAFVLAPLADFGVDRMIGEETVGACLEKVGTGGVEALMAFEESERVAVLGASPKEDRYAYKAQALLMEKGHSVVPVAPVAEEILGVRCVKSVLEIEGKIDTVTLYVGPQRSVSFIEEVVKARPGRVIFNPGTESSAFQDRLSEEGIEFEEACTLVLLHTGAF